MKIALTGITGMVGSHLIKELSKEDSDGNRHEIKALIRETSVVEHLKPYEDVDYIIGGLEDKESLEKLTNGADVVIHLAHFPGPVKTPNELVEVNVDGSFNLLEAVRTYFESMPKECQQKFRLHPGRKLYGPRYLYFCR